MTTVGPGDVFAELVVSVMDSVAAVVGKEIGGKGRRLQPQVLTLQI